MTPHEYYNLCEGDIVYYVAIRFREMVIEPHKVVHIYTIPSRSVFIDGGWRSSNMQPLDRELCFLNLDEASKKLEEIINQSKPNLNQKEGYDLVDHPMNPYVRIKIPRKKPITKALVVVN